MGGSGSKAKHLPPLVVRHRKRRDLISAAANYQYELASAHVSYFRSLKGVGDALQKFVDQELIIVESSPSSPQNSKQDNADELHFNDDDDDSHLSDSSSEDYAHHHLHDSGEYDTCQQHHTKQHHHKVAMFNSESSSKSVSSMSSEENVKTDKGVDDDDAKKMVLYPYSPSPSGEVDSSIGLTDGSSSPEIIVMEKIAKREGVSFEVGKALSSVPPLSLPPRGNHRDLKEAVAEIRDEFHTAAAGYGNEVAVMLEVGNIPKKPSFFEGILSQILFPISPSLSSRDKNTTAACNLSSTLDELYTCEKKLYKEVKEKEKHRILHEKQHKWLECMDRERAKPSTIDAALASEKRLLMKLDVKEKNIIAISTRINKLRDEELQPQVAALIHGLIRMWKAMFKCHQKLFKALMESKIQRLEANTNPTSRATKELERELSAWCHRFNNWIASQKSYVESLNDWLLHCIEYDEPEVTPDGPVPYSPGHLGAPPVFVICNDWHQQMNAVSEVQVANAMNTFAKTLRELWEKQDEEGKGISGLSMMASDYSGVFSRVDDLKLMWLELIEEREKHRDAMNSVHEAAWRTLEGGLFPIFKALEVFTSEALKAHEQVRLQQPGLGS